MNLFFFFLAILRHININQVVACYTLPQFSFPPWFLLDLHSHCSSPSCAVCTLVIMLQCYNAPVWHITSWLILTFYPEIPLFPIFECVGYAMLLNDCQINIPCIYCACALLHVHMQGYHIQANCTRDQKLCLLWTQNKRLTPAKQKGLMGSIVRRHGTDWPVWVQS